MYGTGNKKMLNMLIFDILRILKQLLEETNTKVDV